MAWVNDSFEQIDRGDEKLAPFLKKTWDIVEDPTIDHVVKWSSHGKSFVVLDVELFAKEILPKFFKHSNWSSFVRQLNTYGFRKVDPDRWEFANEYFSKGGKELLNAIQRKKPSVPGPGPVCGRGMEQLQPQQMMQGLGDAPHTAPTSAPGPHINNALPAPYPLDLRTQGLPLFQHQAGAAAALGAQPMMCLQNMQGAGGPGNSGFGAQLQNPPVQQLQLQQSSQAVAAATAAVAAASGAGAPSRGPANPGGAAGPASMERLNVLVGEYLRPGHQILLNMGIQQDSVSKSTSTTSGPSASTTEGDVDMEEDRKGSKRTRGDVNTLSSRSDAPLQVAMSGDGGSKTSVDKHGQPLPPGITRPIAQPLGLTTQNLIAEMAGQLGKLTQLATEVEGLREDNAQMRQGMDAMYAKQTEPRPAVGPIHAMMAEQRDKMWLYKLKNDEVELQMAAQQQAQVVQQERSSVMEARLAQQYKLSFDTAEVTRFLEAKNQELVLQLAIQENVNQSQLHANAALEARVAELEQQLTGKRDELLKGLEDRLMNAMSMRIASAEAAQAVRDSSFRQPATQPQLPDPHTSQQSGQPRSVELASAARASKHSNSFLASSQSQDTGSSHAGEDEDSHRTLPVLGALQLLTCDEAAGDESTRDGAADPGTSG